MTVAAAGDIAHSGSPNIHQLQTADLIGSVIHPSLVLMLIGRRVAPVPAAA